MLAPFELVPGLPGAAPGAVAVREESQAVVELGRDGTERVGA